MNSINKLRFLNHASFALENNSTILLIDPWYEGKAFFNSWALLDDQTSNHEVMQYLIESEKKIFIWFSHEHSDHFSISFLKILKMHALKVEILFQGTLDNRVVDYLRGESFEVKECNDGARVKLDSELHISTWSYLGGDSFCLIESQGISILNVNDCVIDTKKRAEFVRDLVMEKVDKVDILFSQFGYANWIGNESDHLSRIAAAAERFCRIRLQAEALSPSIVVPFASYVYFCRQNNFYLNDFQNSPKNLREAKELRNWQDKIFFMKPFDEIEMIDAGTSAAQLSQLTKSAENHWNHLKMSISPDATQEPTVDMAVITEVFRKYQNEIKRNFYFIPHVLELFRILKPLKIYLDDLKTVVEISYTRGIKIRTLEVIWDISMHSSMFEFVLKNKFGCNTMLVGGNFRMRDPKCESIVTRFFIPQELFKAGYGFKHPMTIFKLIVQMLGKVLGNHGPR